MRMTRKQLRRLIENEVKVVTMTPEQEKELKNSKEAEAKIIQDLADKEGMDPKDVEDGLKSAIAEAVNRVILRSMLTESWSGTNEQELPDVSEKKKKRKNKKRRKSKSKKEKNWYLGSYYFRDNEDFNDFNDFDGGDGGGE